MQTNGSSFGERLGLKYAFLSIFEYAPWSPAGEAAFGRDKE